MTILMYSQEKTTAYYRWRSMYLRPYLDGMFVATHYDNKYAQQHTKASAHGYGMMAAVIIGNRADFDGLFKYYLRFKNKNGLMGSHQNMEKKKGRFSPAGSGGGGSLTGADVDIATSLFLAKNKWGRGGYDGEIDYGTEATDLARSIWEHSFNHETYIPLISDSMKKPDDNYKLATPAHFILSGYWILQQEDTERQEEWKQVIENIISVLLKQLALHPKTGLLADFLRLDNDSEYMPAYGQVLQRPHGEYFGWNSCKTPWRLSHYFALTGDNRLKELLETQADFFVGKLSSEGISADLTLDGNSTSGYYHKAFIAPVRFLVGTLGWNDRYNQMKDTMDDASEGSDYHGNTVALLCTLQFNETRNNLLVDF